METNIAHDAPTKTLSVPISEEVELRLRKRAVAQGLPLEEFARVVLERETALPQETQSPEAWVSDWNAWTASRQRRELSLDDSRDSVYE